MSKRSVVSIGLALLLAAAAACSKTSEPTPAETVTVTSTATGAPAAAPVDPAAASPSMAPSGTVVKGCTLEPETDCRKADLARQDLRGAEIEQANFSEATLSYAIMHRANMRGIDLHRAILIGTNLKEAKLDGATLTDADLSKADLSNAVLRDADITGATMEGAYYCHTIMPDGSENSDSCEPEPRITAFDVQAIYHCTPSHEVDNPALTATYSTVDAVKVSFSDLDREVNGPPKSVNGKVTLNFPCPDHKKEFKHTYTMTATGRDGKVTTANAVVRAEY